MERPGGAKQDWFPCQVIGGAFAFDLDGPDCNDNGICDGADIAGGTSDDSNANGVPDDSAPVTEHRQTSTATGA